MTVEQPITTSHVGMVNATQVSVDLYVNHGNQPSITNAKPVIRIPGQAREETTRRSHLQG